MCRQGIRWKLKQRTLTYNTLFKTLELNEITKKELIEKGFGSADSLYVFLNIYSPTDITSDVLDKTKLKVLSNYTK